MSFDFEHNNSTCDIISDILPHQFQLKIYASCPLNEYAKVYKHLCHDLPAHVIHINNEIGDNYITLQVMNALDIFKVLKSLHTNNKDYANAIHHIIVTYEKGDVIPVLNLSNINVPYFTQFCGYNIEKLYITNPVANISMRSCKIDYLITSLFAGDIKFVTHSNTKNKITQHIINDAF